MKEENKSNSVLTPKISIRCKKEWGEMAKASKIFNDWMTRLDSRFNVCEVIITNVDFKFTPSVENVLFIRLRVKTTTWDRGEIVELRGGTVAMLVNLENEDTGEIFTVLVKQARIATGNFELVEIPAGMIDGGAFLGVAAREIEEELDLRFEKSELTDITGVDANGDTGIYLSPGLLDESCRFYLAERRMTDMEIKNLQGKTCGLADESEIITLKLVRFEDIPKATHDAKTLVAWALYQIHKAKSATG